MLSATCTVCIGYWVGTEEKVRVGDCAFASWCRCAFAGGLAGCVPFLRNHNDVFVINKLNYAR